MKHLLYLLLAILLLQSCNNSNKTPQEQTTDSTTLSADAERFLLQDAQEVFEALPARAESQTNLLTEEKILLGKALYHDARLSKTGNNSCNSCHNLNTFGVDNKSTSAGDAGKNGDRNSPTVLNAAFHKIQFWDGRANDVEQQAGMPILNPVEMAIPSEAFLVKRLKEIKEYQELFGKAFPNDKDPLTFKNIQNAIAAFERTLVTPSAFDNYLNGQTDALTAQQKAGLREFLTIGCQQCHAGATLGGTMLQKFGLFSNYWEHTKSATHDKGRFQETKNEGDEFVFKSCGLRNCAETYPYFHDGSVSDLKEAVRIMAKTQLNKDLSEEQVGSITAFLNSLTGKLPQEATVVPDWVPQVKTN
ncbi:MAG: c-type cytochrome [Chitinophagales bacterium]|nr:c-type cytochrome [Chitinophagales bacterium]